MVNRALRTGTAVRSGSEAGSHHHQSFAGDDGALVNLFFQADFDVDLVSSRRPELDLMSNEGSKAC